MPSETSNSTNISIEQLLEQFSSGSSRKRRGLLNAIESRADDLSLLRSQLLAPYDPEGDSWSAGWLLQVLKRHKESALVQVLSDESHGWFKAPSNADINYEPLQEYLLNESFEEADRFTSATLRKLAGAQAEARGYVYFSEVDLIPAVDLVTIDRLWVAYSQGRFGFSVQARLLASLEGRYDRLWPRIGWKQDGVWTRYPKAFDWSINAPEGHMPLINQLRGIRLMDALLSHEALIARMK